jgi:hypothetical protein
MAGGVKVIIGELHGYSSEKPPKQTQEEIGVSSKTIIVPSFSTTSALFA